MMPAWTEPTRAEEKKEETISELKVSGRAISAIELLLLELVPCFSGICPRLRMRKRKGVEFI